MMRWVAMLHFFLALATGVCADGLLELARRGAHWLQVTASAAVRGGLLPMGVPGYVADVRWGLDTFFESQARESYLAIAQRLREAPDAGRIYTAFFFSSRRRHTMCLSDWSSDVCSSDLMPNSSTATVDSCAFCAPASAGSFATSGARSQATRNSRRYSPGHSRVPIRSARSSSASAAGSCIPSTLRRWSASAGARPARLTNSV